MDGLGVARRTQEQAVRAEAQGVDRHTSEITTHSANEKYIAEGVDRHTSETKTHTQLMRNI